MRRPHRWLGIIPVMLVLAALGPPAPVLADCTTMVPSLRRVDDARGSLFVGRYLGTSADAIPAERWHVERVLHGVRGSGDVDIKEDPCAPIPFETGVRYLVSTSLGSTNDPFQPHRRNMGVTNAVAWRLEDDGRVALAYPADGLAIDSYPAAIVRVHDRAAAVTLMSQDLPATDVTTGPAAPSEGPLPMLPLLAAIGGAAAWFLARRSRQADQHGIAAERERGGGTAGPPT